MWSEGDSDSVTMRIRITCGRAAKSTCRRFVILHRRYMQGDVNGRCTYRGHVPVSRFFRRLFLDTLFLGRLDIA